MSQSATLRRSLLDADISERRAQGRWSRIWRDLRRNEAAIVGAILLVVLALTAILAPVISPYSPIEIAPRKILKPPSSAHLLGTDALGRDILSRILYGARISLRVGFISVGIGAVIGSLIGLTSGYYSGWVDAILMRFVDIMLAFPFFLLALMIVFILGPDLTNAMIAVGLSSVPAYARLVRGSVLSARENVYVEAARAVGCRDRNIMLRHIVPNVVAPVLVVSTLGVARAILSAAALSFLGLGAQPPIPEWGAMLSDGREYLRYAWWAATFPGIAIMVTVLAINMLGDGLRDALDPRLTQD